MRQLAVAWLAILWWWTTAMAQAQAPAIAGPLSPPRDVGELRAVEQKVKQAVAKVLPATVVVRLGEGQGSGVIVSKDGLVLTAAHVVQKPGQKLTIVFPDGKSVSGTSLGVHPETDAGLVRIGDKGQWPCVEMAKPGSIQDGSWSIALGHPLGPQPGRPPVVRIGRVLSHQDNVMQTDCTIVAGDSGGPLVDLEGRVIGINSRINPGMMNMNFHVPIDAFHRSWDRLLKSEVVQVNVPGKDSRQVREAFGQALGQASQCVVRVKSDGGEVALGTIVGPDGWIVTKASQLKGRVTCRMRDGQEREARLVGVHVPTDLAMLKVEASGLPSLPWSDGKESGVGQWVASAGLEGPVPLALGVVGVPPRAIPRVGGMLGVILADKDSPPRVVKVASKSPAEQAGIKDNDLIVQIDGRPMKSREELIAAIRKNPIGTVVKLKIKRGNQEIDLSATLGKLNDPATRKRDLQNMAGPGVSVRNNDFPKVLQHDSVVRPADCGGPLVDLDGRVVGINIARAGRTETYAVPTDVALGLMYELMSGRLVPPKPEPAKSELAKVAPAKPEPTKPQPSKPEATKPVPAKPEPGKPEPAKPEPSKPVPAKPEPSKPPMGKK
jgi:serine protease Do